MSLADTHDAEILVLIDGRMVPPPEGWEPPKDEWTTVMIHLKPKPPIRSHA